MCPGIADARVQQPFDQPYMHLWVNRTKAQEIGYNAQAIAQNVLISLGGSFQTSPTYWLDPKNRVSYQISTQTPQYRVDTLQDLANMPITGPTPDAPPSLLASFASIQRGTGTAVVSHYNIQPVIDIYAAVQGRDLGGVSGDITRIIDQTRYATPPRFASCPAWPGADNALLLHRPLNVVWVLPLCSSTCLSS